ncbi:MAG TPA: hypothetical protein P5305_01505 [Rubrivivax sp.]|nr:hypothetical protein [Rubrivivax sp.]HRY86529.1 hypothetical protein [Rubrivivax sp.]
MTAPIDTQQHMRRCLVRAVLAMRERDGSDVAREWLAAYERKHKDRSLRAQVFEQFDLGNRGAWGDWREPVEATS